MIEILKERHVEVEEYKVVFFQRKDDYAGNGYEYDADEYGRVKFSPEYERVQRENYKRLLTDDNYEAPKVFTRKRTYFVPTLAKCHCGQEIYLQNQYMGACSCPNCDRWYNLSGQELKNPTHWGEDYEY